MDNPGVLVEIGLNSPRISEGESGLRSQVSIWLGPPHWKIRMHDLARPKPAAEFVTRAPASSEKAQEAKDRREPAHRLSKPRAAKGGSIEIHRSLGQTPFPTLAGRFVQRLMNNPFA